MGHTREGVSRVISIQVTVSLDVGASKPIIVGATALDDSLGLCATVERFGVALHTLSSSLVVLVLDPQCYPLRIGSAHVSVHEALRLHCKSTICWPEVERTLLFRLQDARLIATDETYAD